MSISALNESGKTVDWWFAYKLPILNNPKGAPGTALGKAQGTEYLYCDATSPALPKSLSPNRILESGALWNTLKQLRDAAARKDSQVGWFFYNDEYTKTGANPKPGVAPNKANNGSCGHTKGVLAFDLGTNSAFWILHSWPCFPYIELLDPPRKNSDPSPEKGQTFLCITLKDVDTANDIAGIFLSQTEPQIIEKSIPDSVARKYKSLAQLGQDKLKKPVSGSGSRDPEAKFKFTSKGGGEFRYFAKSKDWKVPLAQMDKLDQQELDKLEKDLYSDLIGPKLKMDLEVETWQDGEPVKDGDGIHTTEDIPWIDLGRLDPKLKYAWHFLAHDHAKWAVSKDLDLKNETDWVIVADINRIESQEKRGGGGIAFRNKSLARSLHRIIKMVPPSEDEKVIEANAAKAAAKKKAGTKPPPSQPAARKTTVRPARPRAIRPGVAQARSRA